MSSVVYRNNGNEWHPNNWKEDINQINSYEHQFSKYNPDKNTLVIILGKVNKVEWGDFDVVQNMEWSMIVIHWDLRPDKNLIFVHSSLKSLSSKALVEVIFGNRVSMINGMDMFKIFHDVKRLTLYNVGARKGTGRDISFQSFFGKGVQDGLKLLEQGTLIKNNFFGVGFKDGEKISLGCSVQGKVWSYLILTAAKWTKEMKFHIYIVQPSLVRDNGSESIMLLLGSTHHYLNTVGNVDLKVYSS